MTGLEDDTVERGRSSSPSAVRGQEADADIVKLLSENLASLPFRLLIPFEERYMDDRPTEGPEKS